MSEHIEHESQKSTSSTISRRTFVAGAAALVAVPMAVSALSMAGCSSSDSSDVETLVVDDASLVNFSDFEVLESEGRYVETGTFRLALGSMAWVASDTLAVVLTPGESASPLSQIQMLDLQSGLLTNVLAQAISSDEGYEIYDVRASSEALVWSEYNYLTSNWRLYAASFDASSNSLGDVNQLDEGDENWDPPLFCVDATRVFWTLLPYEEGLYTDGSSYVKAVDASGGEVQTVCTSNGRLATTPERSDGLITIVPRLDVDGVYYALTAMDPDTGETVASATLPKSVKALNAIYMQGTFSFSIEASYSSDSAIAAMGTYRDLGDGTYFRNSKTPACTPAFCKGHLLVKSGKGTAVIDVAAKQYFNIAAPSYSWDYGDYMASTGTCDNLVVYGTVDPDSDVSTAYVLLRVFSIS